MTPFLREQIFYPPAGCRWACRLKEVFEMNVLSEVREDGSVRFMQDCSARPGKGAKQSFVLDSDPNELMRRYAKGGDISFALQAKQGRYEDVSSSVEYQNALNLICEADEQFAALPSKIRAKFRNDPGEMLAYLKDDRNREESYQLGIRVRPEEVKEVVQSVGV